MSLYFSILLLVSTVATAEQFSIWRQLEEMEKNMHQLVESMSKQAENTVGTYTTIFDSRNNQNTIKLDVKNDDAAYVKIAISLPELSEKGVSVDAKGNNLEGSLETKVGGKAIFKVVDGRLFEFSYKLEQKKEDAQQGYSVVSSASGRSEFLPEPVANLENAQVELKDSMLVLSLPKIDRKCDWKKLAVNKI